MSLPAQSSELQSRTARVRALVLDVDGVLTDGRVAYGAGGAESKTFYARDDVGIRLLISGGFPVAIVSGHASEIIEERYGALGVEHLYLGISDKLEAFEKVAADLELDPEEIAYVGDDLFDIALIQRAGLGVAVADAAYEVRQVADLVLRNSGGFGAVRELCEHILKAKGEWPEFS